MRARESEDGEAFSSATGNGELREREGEYDDALNAKGNTLDLTVHEIFGGFANGALARLHYLTRRSARTDRTEYVAWNARQYATHWAQRISAAIVFGDAQRALAQVDKLKRQLTTLPRLAHTTTHPAGSRRRSRRLMLATSGRGATARY